MSASDEAGVILNLNLFPDKVVTEILNYIVEEESALPKQWAFVKGYYERYSKAPDRVIILEQFPELLTTYEVGDNGQYYYDKLKSSKKLQHYQSTLHMAENMVDKGQVDDAINYILQNLSISNGHVDQNILSVNDIDSVLDAYEKRVNRRLLGRVGWPSGFIQIDKQENGLMPGDMLGIMARPGVGKSIMLIHSVFKAWIQGARIVFITPEMTQDDILFRLWPMIAFRLGLRLSNEDLRYGRVSDVDVLYTVLEESKKLPMFHIVKSDAKSGVSTNYVRSLIDEHSPDIVAIDGVRLFSDERSSRGDSWEVLDRIFYNLMDLALIKEIVITVAHQANRGAANTGQAPRLDNAAGGDAMAKACSYVATVARDEQPKIRYTTTQKERFGEPQIFKHPITYDADIGDIGREVNEVGLDIVTE